MADPKKTTLTKISTANINDILKLLKSIGNNMIVICDKFGHGIFDDDELLSEILTEYPEVFVTKLWSRKCHCRIRTRYCPCKKCDHKFVELNFERQDIDGKCYDEDDYGFCPKCSTKTKAYEAEYIKEVYCPNVVVINTCGFGYHLKSPETTNNSSLTRFNNILTDFNVQYLKLDTIFGFLTDFVNSHNKTHNQNKINRRFKHFIYKYVVGLLNK